jgi:hypothetical protein
MPQASRVGNTDAERRRCRRNPGVASLGRGTSWRPSIVSRVRLATTVGRASEAPELFRARHMHEGDGAAAERPLRPATVSCVSSLLHQPAHFARRALPVVRRERVERERPDAECGRRLDHSPHCAGPVPMASEPWQPSGRGPAAVAVHDDGDVETTRMAFFIRRTLNNEVSSQKNLPAQRPSVLRVARISASMWLRYRSRAWRPRVASRNSVRGRRPSKVLTQVT